MKKPKPDELVVLEIVRADGSYFTAHVIASLGDTPTGAAAAFHGGAQAKPMEAYLRSGGFKVRRAFYRKVR